MDRKRARRLQHELNEALGQVSEAHNQLYEIERRLDHVRDPLVHAYAAAFNADPGQKDIAELAANLRDYIRTLKTRPASSQDVETTAVAIIERCAAEAGLDVAAARELMTSEVGALIYVGDALAVACKHGAAYMQRCRKRWKTDDKRRKRSKPKPKPKAKR